MNCLSKIITESPVSPWPIAQFLFIAVFFAICHFNHILRIAPHPQINSLEIILLLPHLMQEGNRHGRKAGQRDPQKRTH